MGGKPWAPAHDRLLLALAGRASVEQIAARVGRSPTAVRTRIPLLRRGGGRVPRNNPSGKRNWSPDEDATLRASAGFLSVDEIAAELGRTATAIRFRAKRLGLTWYKANPSKQDHRGYTAGEVQRMLGLGCAKTVAWWIEAGYLDGERHAVRVGPHRAWRVYPEELEHFLREYRWLYDPARIRDPLWRAFVAGLPPAEYIGTREAARRLCYEVTSVSQLIRKGDLEAEKHGPNWRIPMRAIRAFTPPPFGGHGMDRDELRRRREAVLQARRTA